MTKRTVAKGIVSAFGASFVILAVVAIYLASGVHGLAVVLGLVLLAVVAYWAVWTLSGDDQT